MSTASKDWSQQYSAGDHLWVHLSARFGWWPAIVGERPKWAPSAKNPELDELRANYIKRLTEEKKQVPQRVDLSDLKVCQETPSFVREPNEILLDNKENKGDNHSEPGPARDEKEDTFCPIKFLDDDCFEFARIREPSRLKPYKCPERFDLIKEGVERFDPANFKELSNKSVESAEAKQNTFIKDVETFELLSESYDPRVVEYFSSIVFLDATPEELEEMERKRNRGRGKGSRSRGRKRGGRSGRGRGRGRGNHAAQDTSGAGPSTARSGSAQLPEMTNTRPKRALQDSTKEVNQPRAKSARKQ